MNLKEFLVLAKINTYATAGEGGEKILEDGCKELSFSKEDFAYRDRYFGSNPFVGEEIIWQDNRVIWGMNYYGSAISDEISVKEIYEFLKESMQKVTAERPFRGPNDYKKEDFEYSDKSEGDINFFRGEECIKYKGKEVYKLYYHGGKM